MNTPCTLTNLLPADESVLKNDVFLILLYANRVPPHLAVSVNGKLFTLTVKGATVDGELGGLLKLVRRNRIETVFIRLSVPPLFTLEQLRGEIKKYTLAYPRVDVGIATCLTPIKDFCHSVYETETGKINFVFELLPRLMEQHVTGACYHMNMESYIRQDAFALRTYTMNEIYEGIRAVNTIAV
ncbi:MAG: hypothetical protein AB1458_00575 [Bacteroidota bacterium]